MFVKPWNKDSEMILRQLSLFGRAYTKDMFIPIDFSKNKAIRELTNKDLLDITSNRRKRKTVFTVPLDVMVVPKPFDNGINFHFKRFKLFD
jgi:hypothetical protein